LVLFFRIALPLIYLFHHQLNARRLKKGLLLYLTAKLLYLQKIFSMRKILPLLFLFPLLAMAQFKNDNVLYKTIYWQDFCNQFPKEKEALLLDVRSQGEYDDTSENISLNIGHLKGATHINITDLDHRLSEIKTYKNKPVYLYCSHSQRSRRCSKMLVDSGFTNVININGGLTDLYLTNEVLVPCKADMLQTNNPYQQLNPQQVYKLISTILAVTIVDVRTDSAYKGISGVEKDKALGKLKGSVNIPLSILGSSLDKIPKTRPVLLIDAYGDDAAKAANLLASKGYRNIIISFDGLDAWLELGSSQNNFLSNVIERNIPYQTIDAETFNNMATNSNITVIDIRPQEDYQNKSETFWRNRGHIKGSVNIPVEDLDTASLDKTKPVILTGFGNGPEVFEAAKLMATQGYNKVFVLTPGIWGLRYKAFNSPNRIYLNDWIVDVPEENK